MRDHDWIVGVCEDLKNYAEQNGLDKLAVTMNEAVSMARLDAILRANKDACIGVYEAGTCVQKPSKVIPLRATS